jgi:hypothetical protein
MLFSKKIRPSLILFLSGGIIVLLVPVYFSSGFSESREEFPDNKLKKNYTVFSLDLPNELYFAGEQVPLQQIDIFENLDRELLVNTYWQSQTLLFIKRANRYFPVIEPILQKYGIPDDFKYLAVTESGLTNSVSPANAVGFWQILEGTARDYGLEVNEEVDERYHLEKSTEVACRYILESYKKYGSWTLAAASYNAGRKGIDRQSGRQKVSDYYDLLLGEETGRYLFRVLSFKLILENPSEYGFAIGENHLYQPIPFTEIQISGKIPDFAEFARGYGISYKVLKYMNPWLRDSCLTNASGKTYSIRIPDKGYFKTAVSGRLEGDSIITNTEDENLRKADEP